MYIATLSSHQDRLLLLHTLRRLLTFDWHSNQNREPDPYSMVESIGWPPGNRLVPLAGADTMPQPRN